MSSDAHLFLQSVAEVLECPELLLKILGHLTWLLDIVNCSAVNQKWQAASYNAQPTTLIIPSVDEDCRPGFQPKLTEADFDSIIQCMQDRRSQGSFRHLSSLQLQLEQEFDEDCRGSQEDDISAEHCWYSKPSSRLPP